jgi:protein-tyrosine-phosphatase
MAEAIARHALQTDPALASVKDEVFVASAGLFAGDGAPTTPETLTALAHLGIEFHGRSKRLNELMIRKADHVLVMTATHQAAARETLALGLPGADSGKVALLDPAGRDLADPIGMGQEAYDALARRLMSMVPLRLRQLLLEQPRSSGLADGTAAPRS